MLSHVSFTVLPVLNLDRAIAFWRDTMGLVLVADQPAAGMRWVLVQIPNAPTRVHLYPVPNLPVSQVPAMTLVAPNVPALINSLRAAGVVIAGEPAPAPWNANIMHASFHDSEGNLIMVTSA